MLPFPDEQLWTYNNVTLALINAKTGTAVKNAGVDGKWIIPDKKSPDIIESAFEVLGLSLNNDQLWKSNDNHLSNIRKHLTLDLLDEQMWSFIGGNLGMDYFNYRCLIK